MGQFVEEAVDELASITPTKPAVAQAQPATPAAQPTPAAVPVEEDAVEDLDGADKSKPTVQTEDVEFGDEDLMKKEGLQKLLPDKGKVVRAAILDFVKPKKGHNHYIESGEKKGTYRCLSVRDAKGNITKQAACCDKLGDADMVIVALCVHYTNAPDKDGKYVIIKEDGKSKYKDPMEFDIKWIKLSRSGYRTLSGLPPEEMTVYDIDFTISWRNANGSGGLNYNFSNKARWKSSAAIVEQVKEAAKPYLDGKRLTQKIGKLVSLLELKAAMSGAATDTEEASLGDIEAL